jgi:hypothetical protein
MSSWTASLNEMLITKKPSPDIRLHLDLTILMGKSFPNSIAVSYGFPEIAIPPQRARD